MRRLTVIWIILAALAIPMSPLAAPLQIITVWLPGFAAYRVNIIEDFQAEYSGLRLNLICQPVENYRDLVLTAMVSTAGPDLGLVDFTAWAPLAEAGLCEPLGDYLADMRDLHAITPSLLTILSTGGKVTALPVTAHPMALLIRQDWLTKLGLKPPATWDDFMVLAEAFTKKDPDGDGKKNTYGLAERWPAGDAEAALRFLPWLYQAGGTVAVNQGGKWPAAFGQSAGARALRLRRKLWEAGDIAPSAPTDTAQEMLALFTAGQIGMLMADDGCLPAVKQAQGARVISVLLPRDVKRATFGGGQAFFLNAGSNRKRSAFYFVQWWLSRDTQLKLILGWDGKPGGTGADAGALILSPRLDLDPAALLGEPLYAGFCKSFAYLQPEPYFPAYEAVKSVMAKAIAAAMGPDKTVEEALAAGTSEANAIMSR